MTEKIEQNLISIIHASFEDETNESLIDAKKALQKFRDSNFHFSGHNNEEYFQIIENVRDRTSDIISWYQQRISDAKELIETKTYIPRLKVLGHAEPVISRLGLGIRMTASNELVNGITKGRIQANTQAANFLANIFYDQGACYEVAADFLEKGDAIEHLTLAENFFSKAQSEFSYAPFNKGKLVNMARRAAGICRQRIDILS